MGGWKIGLPGASAWVPHLVDSLGLESRTGPALGLLHREVEAGEQRAERFLHSCSFRLIGDKFPPIWEEKRLHFLFLLFVCVTDHLPATFCSVFVHPDLVVVVIINLPAWLCLSTSVVHIYVRTSVKKGGVTRVRMRRMRRGVVTPWMKETPFLSPVTFLLSRRPQISCVDVRRLQMGCPLARGEFQHFHIWRRKDTPSPVSPLHLWKRRRCLRAAGKWMQFSVSLSLSLTRACIRAREHSRRHQSRAALAE